jgi:hypothetical protein
VLNVPKLRHRPVLEFLLREYGRYWPDFSWRFSALSARCWMRSNANPGPQNPDCRWWYRWSPPYPKAVTSCAVYEAYPYFKKVSASASTLHRRSQSVNPSALVPSSKWATTVSNIHNRNRMLLIVGCDRREWIVWLPRRRNRTVSTIRCKRKLTFSHPHLP